MSNSVYTLEYIIDGSILFCIYLCEKNSLGYKRTKHITNFKGDVLNNKK